MLDGRFKRNISIGDLVKIEESDDNHISKMITGKVKKILSKEKFCENGIDVLLENGIIGPIQEILVSKKSKSKTDVDIIKELENDQVEFKGSFTFDIKRFKATNEKKPLYKNELMISKTIAGFANNLGGTLYIGVEDRTGKILGLEIDYEILSVDPDGFETKVKNSLNSFFNNNKSISKNLEFQMLSIEDENVLKIIVSPSLTPFIVYEQLKYGDGPVIKKPVFYVRVGNGTNNLSAEEFISYWIEHIKNLK